MALWCLDNGAVFRGGADPWPDAFGHLGPVLFRLAVLSRLPPEARAAEVEKWRASLSAALETAFAFAD